MYIFSSETFKRNVIISNPFFFQAEDGIRDAQESRGLGDVYKRQTLQNGISLPCFYIVNSVLLAFGIV